MKRKILVFAPVLALMLSGCFARTPLDPSGTSGTSGKTSGSTSTSSVTPVDDTYGTLDNPITVAKALEIGKAIPGATSDNTVFETKDAYVKGIVKSKPTPGDDNTLSFNFADTYGSSTYIQYWKGAFNSMVKEGDEVVAFGRLAIYKNKSVELTGDSEKSIEPPSVKVVNHIDCTMTLQKTGEGSVEGIPATAKTGDVVTFTVTPSEGYSVEYVKANGTNLVESSGKYSFVVATNTTIVVSLVEGPIVVSDLQKAYEGALAGKTEEFTYSGTVVGTVGNSFYIQEGKYGMYVYSKDPISDIALGKLVEITSTVKTYYDLVETDVVKSAKVTGEGTMPTAATVSSFSDLQLLNQNVLMNIGEAEFVSRDKPWASKTPSIVDFKVGNDTIKVKFDGYGYDADKAELINEAKEGDKFALTNVLSSIYKGTQQVAFVGTSEIAKAGPVVPVTGVELNKTTLSLEVGEDSSLVATVEPSTATNKKVSWSSNKEAVASVDSTGKVLAESEGEAVITVTTEDGGKTASCTVTVKPVSVKSVELNKHELSGVKGGSEKLIATVSPSTAKNKDVTWTVENANPAGCVSVDSEGNVSFVEVGTATVKVTTVDGGKTDTCAVTVTSSKVDVTGIKLDKESITATVGDAAQTITATVEPADATVNTVTWTVEDANPTGCVTIAADGLKVTVTFVAAGSAKVVATSDDSDVTVSKACTVTVNQPAVSSLQTAYETAAGLTMSTSTKSADLDTKYFPSEALEFTGTVTNKNNNTFFVQDGSYGMMVYGGSTSYPAAVVGSKVTVSSKVCNYNGAFEAVEITAVTDAGTGDAITPVKLTSMTQLNSLKQNILVDIDEAVAKTVGTWSSSNAPRNVYTVGSDDITMSFDKYGYNEDKAKIVNGAVAGTKVTFTKLITTAYKPSEGTDSNQLIFGGSESTIEVIPTPAESVEIKEDSYTLAPGANLDMSKEVTILPVGYTSEVTYSVTGNSGVSFDSTNKSLLKIADDAPTGDANKATVTVSANGHSDTCFIVVSGEAPATETAKLMLGADNNNAISSSPATVTDDKNNSWTVVSEFAGDAQYNTGDKDCAHIGSGKKMVNKVTLTLEFAKSVKVSSLNVNLKGNSGENGAVKGTIGTTTILESTINSNTVTTLESTSSGSGTTLTLEITPTKKGAVYIYFVEVVYE